MDAIEQAIVERFVKKEKRERLGFLAAKPARRSDFVHDLLHDTRSLDRSAMRPIDQGATIDEITRKLGAIAAAPAYAISVILDLDRREHTLAEALGASVG